MYADYTINNLGTNTRPHYAKLCNTYMLIFITSLFSLLYFEVTGHDGLQYVSYSLRKILTLKVLSFVYPEDENLVSLQHLCFTW